MPRPKKSKSLLDSEKHTIEFTPARLILSMCALIVFGLVCFLLGIGVNKLDTYREQRVIAGSDVPGNRQTSGQPAGQQVTPSQVGQAKDSGPPSSTAATASAAAPSGTPPERDEVRVVELPTGIPSATGQTDTAATATPSPPVALVEVAQVKDSVKPPVSPAGPPPAPAVDSTPPDSADMPDGASPPAAPVAPASNIAKGRFGVQVGAFKPTNLANADAFKKLLEKQIGEATELVDAGDGWLRVFVGRFPDMAKAKVKQNELRKIAQFKDCLAKQYP